MKTVYSITLFLLCLLSLHHTAKAQENGSVRLRNGKKIENIRLSISFTEHSLSVGNTEGKRDTFAASAVESFTTMDGTFYKSVLWNPEKQTYKLIRCLYDGAIQMYNYRDSIWLKDAASRPQALFLSGAILTDKEEEKVKRILYYYTNTCPRLRKFIIDISINQQKVRETLVRFEDCQRSGNKELPDPLSSEGVRLGFQVSGQYVKPNLEKGGTVLSSIEYAYQPQAGGGVRLSRSMGYHFLFVTGVDFYQRSFNGEGSVAGVKVVTDFERYDLELPLQLQYLFHPDEKHTPLLKGGLKLGYSVVMNNNLLVKSGTLVIENEPVKTSRTSIGGGLGAGWLYKWNKRWELQADYFINTSFMLNKLNGFSYRLPGHQIQLTLWHHFKH